MATRETPESVRVRVAAQRATDAHPWPWWAVGYRPTRRGRARRHAVACTIAAAVEEVALALAEEKPPKHQAILEAALVPFSGDNPPCVKCALDSNATRSYRREPGHGETYTEYLLRKCAACGFGWTEQCADAATAGLEESALVDAGKDAARLAGVVPGA